MDDLVVLRDVKESDLSVFFAQQLDSDANHMAAFTSKDPTDQDAFDAHWRRILDDETVVIKTIVVGEAVVGYVLSYEDAGHVEVSYWIGKAYWGKGLATRALGHFLTDVNRVRPIYARVAKDNMGSRRVLEKCGFGQIEKTKGFANARGEEIEELVLALN